jgi:two-component system chemotaxis response regulator CheB
MPGAVVEAGAADEVLPLSAIPQALVNRALRSSGTLLMKHTPLAAAPAVGTTRLGRPA